MNKKKNRKEFAESLDRRLSGLQGDPWLTQRIIANEEEETVSKKVSVSIALVIALVCVLATGALAAVLNNWGVVDFLGMHPGHIPENADGAISKEEIRVAAERFVCTIQESYYDGNILRMTATVESKEPIMLIGEQELPADPIAENEEITIGEYALKNYNGRMAELSFYLSTMEDESGAVKRNEDGTASIYMEVYYPEELEERDIIAVVSYLPLNDVADRTIDELDSGSIEVYNFTDQERIEIPVHLKSVETRKFEFHGSMDFPKVGVQVTDVIMTETPLEIRYTLHYTIVDLERYNSLNGGLWFEFIDPDSKETEHYAQRLSDGLTSSAGNGRLDGKFDEPDEVGVVYCQADSIGLNALSNQYTIRAYNAWSKERFETRTFDVSETQ